MKNNKKWIGTLAIGLIGGLVGGGIFYFLGNQGKQQQQNEGAIVEETFHFTNNKKEQRMLANGFVKASQAATPSVVYIKTVAPGQQNTNWFDFYFNQRETNVLSSGSGVIFSKDGYIVTNNHVIANAKSIEVIVGGKRSYEAKIIGTDPSSDIALIKIDEKDLPAIQLSSSSAVQVGQWVLAVGNPFNLTSTVTAGIVSAKGRNVHVVDSRFPVESFIQTDAAINPGNSGGALVDIEGKLIGINTAILSKTGSYAGYGFAVPIDIVSKVVNDLKKYGVVQKGFIGAEVMDLDKDLAAKYNDKNLDGVIIKSTVKNGAADKVGLQPGDVILKLEGVEVHSKAEFDEQLSYYRPGDKLKVVFRREGKEISSSISLTNINGEEKIYKRKIYESKSLDASFEKVSKVEQQTVGIENGVKIINPGKGIVSRMGLKEGFIVTHVNGKAITTPSDLEKTLEEVRGRVTIQGVDKLGRKGYYQFIF